MQYSLYLILGAVIVVQQILHHRQQTIWLRIFSERLGIPAENTVNRPMIDLPKKEVNNPVQPAKTGRISIPIPLGALDPARSSRKN